MAENNGPLVVTPQDVIVDPNRPAGAANLPQRSAVEIASEAARAALAGGKPLTAPEPERTRNPDGTFAPEGGQAPSADGAAPAAAAPSTEVVPPVDETPEAKAEREAAEAAAAAAAETPEQTAARELDERTVKLVGRNNSEFEFIAPDAESAEVLRSLRNGFMRGEEVRLAKEEMAQRLGEIENLRAVAEMDPIGFLMDSTQGDPAVMEHLVMFLAAQPENWQRLGPKLMKLADERERRTVASEEKARRYEMEREVATRAEQATVVRRNLEDVQATVGSLLPTEMSEQQQTVLYRDCLRDLKEYAVRHDLMTIPVRDIPALLATRLTAYGINPVEAAARAAEAATRRNAAPGRPASSSPRRPATPPAPPAAPAPTGKELVLSARRKAAAGALPPAGAGSPSGTAPMTPPKNPDGSAMSIEQRIQWHKQQVSAGSRRL